MKYLLIVFLCGCAFEVSNKSAENLNILDSNSQQKVGPIINNFNFHLDENSTISNHNLLQYGCDCTIRTSEENGLICFKNFCIGDCDDACYDEVDICISGN